MDPATIAAIAAVIKTAVDLGPSIIKGVQDAEPFAKAIIDTFRGVKVSQADLDNLQARLESLSAELQAPMDGE